MQKKGGYNMANNVYYDQIMALKGMEGLKDLIERWQRLSENINRFNAKHSMVLPDLLWISDNGIDKDGLIELLTGYLDTCDNLLDFYGNVKHFDYYLEYNSDSSKLHEIQKLSEKVRDAAGFRSEYRGLVSVDLDEWVGHFHEENFINILKFMATLDDDIMFIFNIHKYDQSSVEQLMGLLVLFFRLEVIEMNLPDSEELCAYITKEISEYGLNLDEEAQDMVIATVNTLREDEYFAGYEMLDRLAEDIVYSVYTSTPPYDGIVTKGMISAFAPDGMYVSELLSNNARVFTSQYEN
ncbi:MAG: hypothetical protein MJ105_06250 [Lachnospiraceae bacterium]|nr:hypothetical protein [Lachnospiraceae bacterium]